MPDLYDYAATGVCSDCCTHDTWWRGSCTTCGTTRIAVDRQPEPPSCSNPLCRNGFIPPPKEALGYFTQAICPDCNPMHSKFPDGDSR